MDLKWATISSLIWKLLERGGSSIVSLIIQIILARLLAPEDFGALAIILVFINIGNIIVQSGMNTSLIQSKEVKRLDFSTVFWLALGISIIIYIFIFTIAPLVAEFYSNSRLIWGVRILAFVLIVNAFISVQVAIITREFQLKKVFFASLLSVILSGFIGVVLAFGGFGLWSLIVQQLVAQIVNAVVLCMQTKWIPFLEFDAKLARKHFKYGWKLLASGLLETGYQSFSDLLIGRQFSISQLGLVSQGKKYPQAIGSMLDGAIQPVMLSAFSRLQNNVSAVKELVRRALKTSAFLVMPAMGIFALIADPLVAILLGSQWTACVPFMQMYCVIYALLPIHTTNLQALNGLGRSDLFLKLELIKKSYGIVILCIAAFVFQNIYAIVFGYIVADIIGTFVNAFPNRRIINYSYREQIRDIMPILGVTLVSLATAFPICFLNLPDPITIILQVAIVGIVFLALAWIFRLDSLTYIVSTLKEFRQMMKR